MLLSDFLRQANVVATADPAVRLSLFLSIKAPNNINRGYALLIVRKSPEGECRESIILLEKLAQLGAVRWKMPTLHTGTRWDQHHWQVLIECCAVQNLDLAVHPLGTSSYPLEGLSLHLQIRCWCEPRPLEVSMEEGLAVPHPDDLEALF